MTLDVLKEKHFLNVFIKISARSVNFYSLLIFALTLDTTICHTCVLLFVLILFLYFTCAVVFTLFFIIHVDKNA